MPEYGAATWISRRIPSWGRSMVAINKILLSESTGEGCGGGTRNPPREARLRACSPFPFLLSPFCRRSRPAGPGLTRSHEERQDGVIKRMNLMQKS
jgi:hypothetical protein